MSAHTPGPWVWDGNTLRPENPDPTQSAVHSILDSDGGYGFLGSHSRDTGAELEADRRLIERAPALLAALRRLVDRDLSYFDGMASIPREAILAARAEIELATNPPPTHS